MHVEINRVNLDPVIFPNDNKTLYILIRVSVIIGPFVKVPIYETTVHILYGIIYKR